MTTPRSGNDSTLANSGRIMFAVIGFFRHQSRSMAFRAGTIEFRDARPEFGFISLKGWLGTILMNGC
jgi:hypothetical protein